METQRETKRIAWSIGEISEATGLSVGFLRGEVRANRLPMKKFGRRVLIMDEELQNYLSPGRETNEDGPNKQDCD